MPVFRTGAVVRVVESHPDMQRLDVRVGDVVRRAVLYPRYAAPARVGDEVVLNVTANELNLGSGGSDYVVWNLRVRSYDAPSGGHIVKLRYTPGQSDVLAVEAPESLHHEVMRDRDEVGGMPVVATSVHSQVLPVVAAARATAPHLRIAVVHTDGAALEAGLSDTLRRLRDVQWIAGVVSVGNAIGGDIEAVTLYSGLLAARHVLGADLAIAGMGPGVVGTGTSYGTTALELGLIVNATASLGGRPVACVRMSGADARERHRGVSHHALLALGRVAHVRADVPVPRGHAAALAVLEPAHRVVEVATDGVMPALEAAQREGLHPSHMGRSPSEDPLFFLAAAAAGYHASALCVS